MHTTYMEKNNVAMYIFCQLELKSFSFNVENIYKKCMQSTNIKNKKMY